MIRARAFLRLRETIQNKYKMTHTSCYSVRRLPVLEVKLSIITSAAGAAISDAHEEETRFSIATKYAKCTRRHTEDEAGKNSFVFDSFDANNKNKYVIFSLCV